MSKKSMLKRVSAFCLMGVMVFGLAACGQKLSESAGNIGKFETTDLEKNKVTQDIFKENDLTMVNLFSSTCNPCMGELPHLAELSTEYKDKKVGIVGINNDVDASGNPDENSRKAVLKVLGKNKGEMKLIFWDKNLKELLSQKADALPYSFFVDKEGNIVGEEYLGARSKEDWAKIIDDELANIAKK